MRIIIKIIIKYMKKAKVNLYQMQLSFILYQFAVLFNYNAFHQLEILYTNDYYQINLQSYNLLS